MRRKATLYPVAGSFQGKNRDCWRRRKRRAGERDGEDSLLERVTTEERQLSHNWPTVLFRRQIDPDLVSRANTMQQVAGTTTDFQHARVFRDEQVVAMRQQIPVGRCKNRRLGLGLVKLRHQLEVRRGAGCNFRNAHGLFERQIARSAAKDDNLSPTGGDTKHPSSKKDSETNRIIITVRYPREQPARGVQEVFPMSVFMT